MKAFFKRIKDFVIQHKLLTVITSVILVLSLLISIFWIPIATFIAGKVQVTFESNGADEVQSIWIEKGEAVPQDKLIKLSKENNVFMGWFSDEQCTIQYIDSPIMNNTTLYAGFVENPKENTYDLDKVYIGEVGKDFVLPIISSENITNDNLSDYVTLNVKYGKNDNGDDIKLSVEAKGEDKYIVSANYAAPGSYVLEFVSGKAYIDENDEQMKNYSLAAGNRAIHFNVGGETRDNVVLNEEVKDISQKNIIASNDKAIQISTDVQTQVGDIILLPYLDGTNYFKITAEITKAQAQAQGLTVDDTPSKYYSVSLAEIDEVLTELDVFKKEVVDFEKYANVDELAADVAETLVNSKEMNDFTTLLLQASQNTPTIQTLSARSLGTANTELKILPLAAKPTISLTAKNAELCKKMNLPDNSNFLKVSVNIERSATITSLSDGALQIDANVSLEFYLYLGTEGIGEKKGSGVKFDVGIVTATQTTLDFNIVVSTKDDSPQALITGEVRDVLSSLEDTPADDLVELYNRLVPDSESDRAELLRTPLLAVPPTFEVGIVEISFPVELVISVDFRVALSAEYTVMTKDKHGVQGTDDGFSVYESNYMPKTSYKINVQGKIDMRVGVAISARLSFTGFSSLGNIKMSVQAGAYVKLYGLGYLNKYENNSSYGGACYIEAGAYFNFSVSATILSFTASKDIFDVELRLYDWGQKEVLYGFAESSDEPVQMDYDGIYLHEIDGMLDTYVFDITADNPADRLRRQDESAILASDEELKKGYALYPYHVLSVTFDNDKFEYDKSTGYVSYNSRSVLNDSTTMTIHYTGNSLNFGESLTKKVKVVYWDERVLGEYDESKANQQCKLTLTYNGDVYLEKTFTYGDKVNSRYELHTNKLYLYGGSYLLGVSENDKIPEELAWKNGVVALEFNIPVSFITEDITVEASKVTKSANVAFINYLDENDTWQTDKVVVPFKEIPDISKYENASATYAIVGWDKPINDPEYFYNPNGSWNWDKYHFYAQYAVKYTAIVEFDTDGGILKDQRGETVNSNTVTATWNETMSGYRVVNTASKKDYNFKGWEYNGKTYGLYDYIPLEPGETVTLKAVFERKPIAITFETYNGSIVQYYNSGDEIQLPSTEMNDIYLTGWKSKNDAQTYSLYYIATADDTLTAVYAESGALVDFDLDGGIFPDGTTYRRMCVPFGEKCNMTDVPVIDRGDGKVYVFSHWTPNFDEVISKRTTFKAVYKEEKKTYTVTFDLNGGKMPSSAKLPDGAVVSADGSKISLTVTAGAAVPVIEHPILVKGDGKNYGFVEWTPAFELVTADVTYKAIYEEVVVVGPGEDVDNPVDPGDTEGVKYKFENGVLTIYGTGKIDNYIVDNEGQNVRPWDTHYDQITKIVIEDGITYIGNHAFSYLPNLTTVEMADSVTSAGFCCFMDCPKLTNVKLSNGIKCNQSTYDQSDGNDFSSMFSGCTSLKSITLPSGFERVPTQMFHSCESLQTVNLPDSLKVIENGAFINCISLMSITLPDTLQTIEGYAFSGCTALESVIGGNNATVEEEAFSECPNLKN